MKKVEFRAMGCRMQALVDSHARRVTAPLLQAPVWFEQWEQSLSRFRPDSELNLLNRSRGLPFTASQPLWDVLNLALRAEDDSGGLVTPVVLDALEFAGYDRSFDLLPQDLAGTLTVQADGALNPPERIPGPPTLAPSLSEGIELDHAARTVTLRPGLRLDFGGVAKGWAAHQAMRRLSHYSPALVSAGGDIAVSGPRLDGSPWPVGITNPFKPHEHIALLHLGRGGVATSGRDYRRWRQGEAARHHIIDPRHGLPAVTDILSATVVAPDVMQAEMAAKTVFILGSRAGLEWLAHRPHYAVYLVLEGATVITNPLMRKLMLVH